MKTLSQEQLANLNTYRYSAVDKSYLSNHVLRHYWNWAVTLFPRWMAPNLITFLGLLLMIFNVALVIAFAPDLGDEAPRWLYFSFAIGLWLYSTFDNVDGKQARRTGSSSPLGELFDHGCDALNTTYVSILMVVAFGLGQSQLSVVLFITTMAGFYLSTAEEYFTGVLYLGYINGPTEGIVLTCIAFIISGFYGPEAWHIPLAELDITLISRIAGQYTGAQLLVWGTVVFFALTHCPVAFYAIIKACRHKSYSLVHAFSVAVLPMAVYCLITYYWAMSPYSTILANKQLLFFFLGIGTLFGFMASTIIVAHVTKSPFPNHIPIIAPVFVLSLLVNMHNVLGRFQLSSLTEMILVWCLFIGSLAGYTSWAMFTIRDICRHLGIQCFRIPHNKPLPRTPTDVEQGHSSNAPLLAGHDEQSSTAPSPPPKHYNTFMQHSASN